jgi:streptogramin lyase
MARSWITVMLLLCAGLATAGGADAITPTITEFSSGLNPGSDPRSITAGPEGTLWFTDGGTTQAIGRITTAGSIHEFDVNVGVKGPFDITAGADGNLWFTTLTPAIWRITPTGSTTSLGAANGLNSHAALQDIAAGPDGNVWFADSNLPGLGRVTPTGEITEFSTGPSTGPLPNGVTAGPDGNLWFTDSGNGGHPAAIGQFNPSTHDHTDFSDGVDQTADVAAITQGPDGNLWFLGPGPPPMIGRISPTTHTVVEFSLPSGASPPPNIADGTDGAVWFVDDGPPPAIGRITTDGVVTEYSAGLSGDAVPNAIAPGPDGNMWFTDNGTTTKAIGRITTGPVAQTLSASAIGPTSATINGSADGHAQPTSFHVEYGPSGGPLTATPEQGMGTTAGATPVSLALTSLRPSTAYLARVVVTNPTASTAGALISFTTGALVKGRLGALRISPSAFRAAARGGSVASARRAGAIVSYTDSQQARTSFTVQRPGAGRRQGHACRKPTRRNRHGKRCTRYLRVGSFTHADAAGPNRFRFTGRVHGRKLKPGRYRLRGIPTDAAGAGPAAAKAFRIKR